LPFLGAAFILDGPAMSLLVPHKTVAERLRRARRHRFVGRDAELALFREAVEAGEPAFAVLFVHGPGGVGKTALLEELAGVAEAAGVPSTRIDLRSIEPSPPAFRGVVAERLGLEQDEPVLDALAREPRQVLLLDTYETVATLEPWLREHFLPALHAGTLVVIAGRTPPGPEWLADPGWRALLRVVPLQNLSPAEARAYLRAEGVAPELHERAFELTHGHPLALSLLVDVLSQQAGADTAPRLELSDAPDAVRPLLERFIREVPNARHRRALEACAHARFTTEDLLRSVLGGDDAGELFAWLRTLSFVEESRHGVFPHDLARDVLDADLRWRAPDTYAALHRSIRGHVRDRLRHGIELATRTGSHNGFVATCRRAQIEVADLIFMHRRNPLYSDFMDWETFGQAHGDRLRPGDREAIVAMTEHHEGPESARLVAHWLERRPDAFVVFRAAVDEPRGFVAILPLHDTTEADLEADPGALAMWRFAQRHGAPRPGEGVFATRFLIDRDAYQGPASLNVASVAHTQHILGNPHAVWHFSGPWADPDRIEPMMSYIDFFRAREADYEVGGRRYGVFAHDWRRTDVDAWLDLTGERELAGADQLGSPAEPSAPEAALSRAEFADAARRALRDLHRSDALARNPIMRARMLADLGGRRPSVEALRDLIERAIDTLRVDPRDEKLHRALARTYVRPAQTQELAAEALGLPFSTYRRHLTRGVERVTEWLWERELYGPDA
jgi:DNA-directed RNA polymerase specialized sigma24 family protein